MGDLALNWAVSAVRKAPIMRFLTRFIRSEKAATAVEYSIILAMILLVALASIRLFGTKAGQLWTGVASSAPTTGQARVP